MALRSRLSSEKGRRGKCMYGLLIAEDEVIESMVLRKMLEKKFGRQCRIFETQNGKDAVECFRRENIQIAILDIAMPGMNGIQAAQIMRSERPECCLIFLTAYDRFDYAKKAISVRAMEYLLKPYSAREVISVVEEAIHLINKSNPAEQSGEGYGLLIEKNKGTDICMEEEGKDLSRLSILTDMIQEYVRTHYMQEISMHDAAEAMGYSEAYFCRIFKQQFGQNFTAYLAEYRIGEAKKLLIRPDVNVKEVGQRVGYPDSSYFTKVFRRLAGSSPSEYRLSMIQELK